jgi:hypothetical protein
MVNLILILNFSEIQNWKFLLFGNINRGYTDNLMYRDMRARSIGLPGKYGFENTEENALP